MNTLKIDIIPSEYSNDHQVVIKIDNKNCIEGFLGIDPVIFFAQDNLYMNGKINIGRCDCGEVGCGSKEAIVDVNNDYVSWKINTDETYTFNKKIYFDYLSEIEKDKSWEDEYRRIERLINNVFKGTSLKGKRYFNWKTFRIITTSEYEFNWASSRITHLYNDTDKDYITLSYSLVLDEAINGVKHQELLSIPWYKNDELGTIEKAKKFKENNKRIKKVTK